VRTIFICYASEDKPAAERVQLALVAAGYKVFFDEQSLPAGGDYHARIERAIRTCDLLVFLVTPSSIARGKFTMTELKFARERWPNRPEDGMARDHGGGGQVESRAARLGELLPSGDHQQRLQRD
jgi:hypothetical protein